MNRIEKLRAKLPTGFAAALIENPYNRGYLTEFLSSAGSLLVTENDAKLFVDFRYVEMAREGAKGVEVILADKLLDQLAAAMRQAGLDQLYLEDTASIAALAKLREKMPEIEFICDNTLEGAIKALRSIKEPAEVAAIRAAQEITDMAFSYIIDFIEPGQTEREIAAELEYFARANGADGMAFPTICVAGKKSSLPHGVPGENTVERGDFLTMDFGAFKSGYCSDMTRTVAVGSVSDEQKKVYNLVLEAHLAAEQAAKAGIRGSELDKVARDLIYAAGYEGCFGHGLGHSLGLEVHESPRASVTCDEILEAGTIMTIEPGIYLAGRFGVRIENMVLITDMGCENLTESERELIIL